MARTMVVLAVVFVSLAIGVFFALQSLDDIPFLQASAQEREVQRLVDGHCRFTHELQETMRKVEAGWSLERAVETVLISSQDNYPAYLEGLKYVVQLPSERERIAQNLLFHFIVRQEELGGCEHVIRRLEGEMADMFGHGRPPGNQDARRGDTPLAKA